MAVSFGEERLTYGELNRKANRLAHHLRTLGVGPDVPVGLCVERSLELAVGVLGILKAGGAYVPLDPAYPPERLALMLEASRAPVLLTQRRAGEALPASEAKRLYLDVEESSFAQRERGQSGEGVGAGGAGVRHLHLGLDGSAEGSGDAPRAAAQPDWLAGGRARCRRRRRCSSRR